MVMDATGLSQSWAKLLIDNGYRVNYSLYVWDKNTRCKRLKASNKLRFTEKTFQALKEELSNLSSTEVSDAFDAISQAYDYLLR